MTTTVLNKGGGPLDHWQFWLDFDDDDYDEPSNNGIYTNPGACSKQPQQIQLPTLLQDLFDISFIPVPPAREASSGEDTEDDESSLGDEAGLLLINADDNESIDSNKEAEEKTKKQQRRRKKRVSVKAILNIVGRKRRQRQKQKRKQSEELLLLEEKRNNKSSDDTIAAAAGGAAAAAADTDNHYDELRLLKRDVEQVHMRATSLLERIADLKTKSTVVSPEALAGHQQKVLEAQYDIGLLERKFEKIQATPVTCTTIAKSNTLETSISSCSDTEAPIVTSPMDTLQQNFPYLRVHDLNMNQTDVQSLGRDDMKVVLDSLVDYSYALLCESQRFTPINGTEKLLATLNKRVNDTAGAMDWPTPTGNDVLVWQGSVDREHHKSDMPVIKARGVVKDSPQSVLDLLMDSTRVREYNKMSQGRTDVAMLQQGVHTSAKESEYGVMGEVKVMRALNKPPLMRRCIEMLTLLHARPWNDGSYIIVSRSMWEDETCVAPDSNDSVRSEMLLSVTLLRPVMDNVCEMTTLTHVHTTAVPEGLAKRMGPSQTVNYIKEIQKVAL